LAQVTITQLPAAQPLTGTESVPISQNGQTVQTTVAAIANSPTQQQTFITVNAESTLPNSRRLQGGTGVGLTDTGALGTISVILNGASGSLESSTNGMIAKTSGNTVVGRTLTGSSTGVVVTNGDGMAGNPVIALTGAVGSINGLSGSGLLTLQNGASVGSVSIQGTANQIDVANSNGLSGDPTVALASNPIIPGTGGMVVPVGTTAQRGAGVNGTIRYNTDIAQFEIYDNGWGNLPAGAVSSVDVSGGTTGLTTSGGPITTSGTITIGGTLNVGSGGTGATTLTGYVKGNGTSTMTASATVPVGDLSGTLPVGSGGTGATTLTGYVKGNGTSAMTASATIPNTDITGLGTMSTQAANSVAITGGNIDGTTIGNTVPAAGTFTSVAMTTGTITTAPASGNDIVNRTYADSIAAGINFHQSVKYATTTALPAVTYANGTGGVGATLTANANGALTVDGYTFTSPADNGTRILIKNQAAQLQNGVYTLTQAGTAGLPFILTRATDFDTAGSGVDQIDAGDFFLVTAGSANANTSWVQQTPLPITVGTTAIVFAQFGAPIVYSAGTGLSESPSYTFNIANTTVAAGNYGGAATAVTLSINAQGQITSATDVSIAIAASQITSGQVAIAAGGTNGTATPTAGAVAYGTGAAYGFTSAGNSGDVLTSGGSGAPTFAAQSTLSVGSATTATTATNLASGAANQIAFQTNASTTSFITAPTVSSTFLQWNGSAFVWASAGTGTVTSVGLALPAEFTISGSPVTSSGTLTGAWANATANYVFAGPTTGSPDTPSFRALVAADVPTLNQNTTGSAGSVANSVTFDSSGGAAPNTSFNGSTARTIDYSTVGAPKADGTGASGTWSISISGSAGSATNATNVAVTADATNASRYLGFYSATTGNLGTLVDADLTYNPSTNTLTTATLVATTGISGGTF
jgi:hypothetical protein